MLVIRLLRIGKKNQPSFKIVVTDKREATRSGNFLEEVGFYNPLTKERVLKKDRIKYWISKGAKPLESIHNLLIEEKILEGKKIPVHKKPKKKEEKPVVEKVAEKKEEPSVAKAMEGKKEKEDVSSEAPPKPLAKAEAKEEKPVQEEKKE